jgi:hypothetical protein
VYFLLEWKYSDFAAGSEGAGTADRFGRFLAVVAKKAGGHFSGDTQI